MTLRQYFQALRRRWAVWLAVTIGFVAMGFGITALMPKIYSASATNFVSTTAQRGQQAQLYPNSQYAISQVTSYVELIHSPNVLNPVIDQLGLDVTLTKLDQSVAATNPANTATIVVTARFGSASLAKDVANAVSESLAREIESLETPAAGQPSPVRVKNEVPAKLPTAPASPRTLLNLAAALLFGLGIGAVAALIRDQLDTTLKTTTDIENEGIAVLGTVRHDTTLRRQPLSAMGRRTATVDDFWTIRTNLQFTDVDSPPRRIVVSSAVSREGKTLTCVNLAITLAQADLNVCLVEADLRRPAITSYLGIDGSLGLSDVAAGLYSADDVLVPWNRGTLTILPAGTTPPDPIRLLGSHAVHELFDELQRRFDVVIIDAPPLLPASDAALLGRTSDGVILVARHRFVRRDEFEAAVASLRAVGATIIGAVLTQVPARDRPPSYGRIEDDLGLPAGLPIPATPDRGRTNGRPSAQGPVKAAPESSPAPANGTSATRTGLKPTGVQGGASSPRIHKPRR